MGWERVVSVQGSDAIPPPRVQHPAPGDTGGTQGSWVLRVLPGQGTTGYIESSLNEKGEFLFHTRRLLITPAPSGDILGSNRGQSLS